VSKRTLWDLPLLLLTFKFSGSIRAQEKGENIVEFQEQSGELQGLVRNFESERGLLVVEKNSIPYSFQITPSTKISIGGQKTTSRKLIEQPGKSITIKFTSTRKGDPAKEISAPERASGYASSRMDCEGKA